MPTWFQLFHMCICVFVLTFLSPRSGFQNQAVLDMAITKVKCHIIARTHSTNMTSLLMLTLVIWSRWCLGGLFTVKSLLWICHLLWKKLLYTPNSKTGSYAPVEWEEDFPHKWLNTALGSFLFLSRTYLIIYFYAFVDIDFILWIVNQYYFMFSSKFFYLCHLGALPAGSYVAGFPPSVYDFLGLKTFPYFLAPDSSYKFPATVLGLVASPGNSGFAFCFSCWEILET